MYRASKTDTPLSGTWDGSNMNIEKKMDLRIVFGAGNEVQLYSNAIEYKGKATYTVNRNEVIITGLRTGRDSTKERLKSYQNHVHGNWGQDSIPDGNFYLIKALPK
jgi:hypothetical protein